MKYLYKSIIIFSLCNGFLTGSSQRLYAQNYFSNLLGYNKKVQPICDTLHSSSNEEYFDENLLRKEYEQRVKSAKESAFSKASELEKEIENDLKNQNKTCSHLFHKRYKEIFPKIEVLKEPNIRVDSNIKNNNKLILSILIPQNEMRYIKQMNSASHETSCLKDLIDSDLRDEDFLPRTRRGSSHRIHSDIKQNNMFKPSIVVPKNGYIKPSEEEIMRRHDEELKIIKRNIKFRFIKSTKPKLMKDLAWLESNFYKKN